MSASSSRALLVVTSPGPVIADHLNSVVPRLLTRGFQVSLAVASHLAPQYARLPVPVRTLPMPERSNTAADVAAASHLRHVIREEGELGVLHAHGFRSCALSALALRGVRPRPAFVTSWYDLALPSRGRGLSVRAAERVIARLADVTLATSLELQARAVELGAGRVLLTPVAPGDPGAAVSDREALRERYAAELGLRPERPWVLVVGRLVPERSGQLLTMARRWRLLHPPPEFVAVGEGAPGVASSLRATAAAEGLSLTLVGPREDTGDLMSACDVLVTMSRWESRPMAVQQAMQRGLPVVAARLAGIGELLDDTGVLVAADDHEALAGEVAALLGDPDRAARLAERARRRAAGFPSEDDVATRLAEVYAEVLAPHGG